MTGRKPLFVIMSLLLAILFCLPVHAEDESPQNETNGNDSSLETTDEINEDEIEEIPEDIEDNVDETAEEHTFINETDSDYADPDAILEEAENVEEVIDAAGYVLDVEDYFTKYQEFISDSRWDDESWWSYDHAQNLSTGWIGYGCFAYASDFVKYMFNETFMGASSSNVFTDEAEIRNGDVINTGEMGQHWIVILERNGNELYTAEGNYSNRVLISHRRYEMRNGELYNIYYDEPMFVLGVHYDLRFSDVYSPSQYYYDAVYWALKNRITQGTGETTFSPGNYCKRYHFVLFLWRLAGCPEPENEENPFDDVYEDDGYYKAVLWAYQKEITTGISPDSFAPKDVLTRGQVVTFLYRMAGEPELTESDNPFADVDADKFYYEPVLWAAQQGITTGVRPDEFCPVDVCTRGQTVVFIYRQFK